MARFGWADHALFDANQDAYWAECANNSTLHKSRGSGAAGTHCSLQRLGVYWFAIPARRLMRASSPKNANSDKQEISNVFPTALPCPVGTGNFRRHAIVRWS